MMLNTLLIMILVAIRIDYISCDTLKIHVCEDDADFESKIIANKDWILPIIVTKNDNPLNDDIIKHYESKKVSNLLIVPADKCSFTDTCLNRGEIERVYPSLFMLNDGHLIPEKTTEFSLENVIHSLYRAKTAFDIDRHSRKFPATFKFEKNKKDLNEVNSSKKAVREAKKRGRSTSRATVPPLELRSGHPVQSSRAGVQRIRDSPPRTEENPSGTGMPPGVTSSRRTEFRSVGQPTDSASNSSTTSSSGTSIVDPVIPYPARIAYSLTRPADDQSAVHSPTRPVLTYSSRHQELHQVQDPVRSTRSSVTAFRQSGLQSAKRVRRGTDTASLSRTSTVTPVIPPPSSQSSDVTRILDGRERQPVEYRLAPDQLHNQLGTADEYHRYNADGNNLTSSQYWNYFNRDYYNPYYTQSRKSPS